MQDILRTPAAAPSRHRADSKRSSVMVLNDLILENERIQHQAGQRHPFALKQDRLVAHKTQKDKTEEQRDALIA
jgi:hypothetical protein